jgi:hypothetical protein
MTPRAYIPASTRYVSLALTVAMIVVAVHATVKAVM